MDQVKIKCCFCGGLTVYNQAKMCVACLQARVNIVQDIPKEVPLQICRYCEKYNRPPWLSAKLESPQLLNICLRKVKNLSKFKIIDSSFIWTEPHSKRLKIRIKVQQDIEGILMEQECIVTYVIQDTQCEDCQKSFTPHTWVAKVQIRQKADHMRTLHNFEQCIIKNNANKDFMAVKQKVNGFDVHFTDKNYAKTFVDFIHGHAPAQVKASKQLISSDFKSNIYEYKHTFVAEFVPVCRDDLIILPSTVKIYGLGRVLLCTKVTNQIRLMDVISFQCNDLKSTNFWKNPFNVFASKDRLVEFVVLDIEDKGNRKWDIEVAKSDSERFGEVTQKVWSHFGKHVNCGDIVLGYDLASMVEHEWDEGLLQNIPDVILVGKKREESKRKTKKRLPGLDGKEVSESESADEQEIENDVEGDKAEEAKEVEEVKEAQEAQDAKDAKDAKDTNDANDAKDIKEGNESKNAKEIIEAKED